MKSRSLQEAPADEAAAEFQEGFVDVGPALKTDSEPTKLMQPCDRSLDYPAGHTQTTAVWGTTRSDLSADALVGQGLAMGVGIVGSIGLYHSRFVFRAADFTRDRGNLFDQGHELGDVVVIGGGENCGQRNTLRVREEVVFAARTTAIGWVRSSFFPAPTARMEELSATALEKSICSAARNRASSTRCSRFQTPRRCQCLSRRQHVIPEPQPISLGSISQGIPDLKTNKMPVSTRRSSRARRPVYRLRLRLLGNNGSMCVHNSSSINGLGIRVSPQHAMLYRTKTFTNVQASFC
jgi:hypothetical protein